MTPLSRFLLSAVVLTTTGTGFAQGPPGHGYPPPGHGGVPPGQARRYNDWRFRGNERAQFYSHYRRDVRRWRNRRRPVFVVGQPIPPAYAIQPMPPAYWQGVPPPPPGYQYGYYGGYAVAYNPTTRIIADVLDLVTATTVR